MKTEVVRLRVSPEMKARIKAAADRENRTISNWIENLVKKEIETMKPTVKRQDIIDYLISGQSIQTTNSDQATYVICIDSEGNVGDPDPREATFYALRDISAYHGDEDMDRVYNSESMDDETFRDMVDTMIEKIAEEFEVV